MRQSRCKSSLTVASKASPYHVTGVCMNSCTDRPSTDLYEMMQSLIVSSRAGCQRRRVGCVLVNELNHVLATGYNGPARGRPPCSHETCLGLSAKSGTNLDGCMAIHAEQNALLQCRNVQEIHTAYVTAAPCVTCTKLLLNTSCQRIVFLTPYPHSEAQQMWTSAGREWTELTAEQALEISDRLKELSYV